MELTALHTLLWLLTALTLTTQELEKLSVSPKITAECGKQVTLNCSVSSSLHQLSIKHMEWSRNMTTLCVVGSDGNVKRHHKQSISDFTCEFEQGHLSLTFQQVQPLETGDYQCKLRSNRGAPREYTTVELQECSGKADGVSTDGRVHTCIFNRVYPDGDVDWLYGSHKVSDETLHSTTKQVDQGGWLTIRSNLKWPRSDVSYNCSLKGAVSGRYIASTLVTTPGVSGTHRARNGVGSLGPVIFLCIPVLLAVTLK